MTDWGGPIGLDFARRHPERVKRLVIANTWCWLVGDDFHFKSFSFLMSSWIRQYLLRHHNIFVNGVMPRAVGDRSVLTPEIMAHYRCAQPSPAARVVRFLSVRPIASRFKPQDARPTASRRGHASSACFPGAWCPPCSSPKATSFLPRLRSASHHVATLKPHSTQVSKCFS